MNGHGDQQILPVAPRPPVFSRTKFLAPQQRAAVVPRAALVDRLRAAGDLPLTIVVGSPGSGKSSLLTQWFRDVDDGTIAWLAADRGDDDPTRFWWGFIRAVQHVDPAFGVEAADLMTLDGHVSADVLESLLDADARLEERTTLVIDDFHLVSLVAAQQLQHLLERGLQHLRLVIGSRSDPAVGLPRLRVQHAVAEVREADLRLSVAETRPLLANMGLDPQSVDTAALVARTEGWAAGLQMAALSVIGSDDPAARILELAGTTQTIAGYLTAEVLANQTDHVRRFLEDTCVVDELDGPLCAALTDLLPDGTRVTLQDVEAANLMLVRVDAAGTVYRYHHLFGELLRHRLHANDPERFRAQHARAAAHFREVGDVTNAVRHLWHAGRAADAAQLLRDQLDEFFMLNGTPPPVDHTTIPDHDELRDSPGEAVGYAVGLMLNGQPQLARDLIRRADAIAAPADSSVPVLDRAQIVATRVVAELAAGEPDVALDLVPRLRAVTAGQGLDDDPLMRTALPFAMRAAVWQHDWTTFDELHELVVRNAQPRVRDVDLAGVLGFAAVERGEIERAVELLQASNAAAAHHDVVGSGPHLATRAALGAALVDAGRLQDAALEVAAVAGAFRSGRLPVFVQGALADARLCRANGNLDAALTRLAEARARVRSVGPGPVLATRIDHAEVTLRLALGQTDRAEQLRDGMAPGQLATSAAAWIAAARHDWARVSELDDVLAESATTPRRQLDLALLRNRAAIDRGDDAGAEAEAVFDIAERHGMAHAIAEAGTDVLQVVCAVARRRPRTAFVERLSLIRPLPRPTDRARPAFRMDELSSRELIVLRYMATSMSNQEIADALYLSVNTVKTHIKHVLRKLHAGSRAEATRKAQELRYL